MKNEKLLKTKIFNTSKGITLIALVITIIVLLILARNLNLYVSSVIILYFKEQQALNKPQKEQKLKNKHKWILWHILLIKPLTIKMHL